eukprot:scpid32610/ scgid0506/ C2 domain-containing protein 3
MASTLGFGPISSGDEWHGDVLTNTGLPPAIQGQQHAVLRCEVSQVVWLLRPSAPREVVVTLRWWGEPGRGSLFSPQLRIIGQQFMANRQRRTVAVYPVVCSLEKFHAYVRDMQVLVFEISDGISRASLGQARITDFQSLIEKAHQRGSYPIMASPSRKVAQIHVYLSLKSFPTAAQANLPYQITRQGLASNKENVETTEVGGKQESEASRSTQASSSLVEHSTQTEPGVSATSQVLQPEMSELADNRQRPATNQYHDSAGAGQRPLTTFDEVEDDVERCVDLVIGDSRDAAPPRRSAKRLHKLSKQLFDSDQSIDAAAMLSNVDTASVAESDVSMESSTHGDYASSSPSPNAGQVALNHNEQYGEEDDEDILDEELIAELFYKPPESVLGSDGEGTASGISESDSSDPEADADDHTSNEHVETTDEGHLHYMFRRSNQRPPSQRSVDNLLSAVDAAAAASTASTSGVEQGEDAEQWQLGRQQSSARDDALEHHSQNGEDDENELQFTMSSLGKGSGVSDDCEDEVGTDVSSNVASSSYVTTALGLKDCLGIGQLARLGRVRAARVLIHSLLFTDTAWQRLGLLLRPSRIPRSKHSAQASRDDSGRPKSVEAVFAEYCFPVMASSREGTAVEATETVRVAAKLAQHGVQFHHRSVFPVHFNESVLSRWWQFSLEVKIYVRRQAQRPELVGSCVHPLRSLLLASGPTLCSEANVPLLSAESKSPAVRVDESADSELQDSSGSGNAVTQFLGTLKMTVELSRDGKAWPSPQLQQPLPQSSLNAEKVAKALSAMSDNGCQHLSTSTAQANPLRDPGSSTLQGKYPSSPDILHLLLLIPSVQLSQDKAVGGTSSTGRFLNPYLVCRTAFNPQPVSSDVRWGTLQPVFKFRLLVPVLAEEKAVKEVCNSVIVVEVWNRDTQAQQDKLIGLVKLPAHQFYFSFRDSRLAAALYQMKMPVVAVNGDSAILPLASSSACGSMRTLLAMGTAEQISNIEKSFADRGAYMPHEEDIQPSRSGDVQVQENTGETPATTSGVPVDSSSSSSVEHVFTVDIVAVHQLTLPPSQQAVWGETDCYVQYRFPTISTANGNAAAAAGG